uniref:Uncharacterized protein n=1 Tax=Amphimedon queenslandica TaxID=400682 RepID=A0A1X7TVD4_AMPQE
MATYVASLNVTMPIIAENFDLIDAEVKQLTETMGKLQEIKEVKDIVTEAFRKLKEANGAFYEYYETMTNTFQDIADKSKVLVSNPEEYSRLEELISNLAKNFTTCEEKYKKFQQLNKSFISSCETAQAECTKLAEENQTKKKIVQGVGGAGAAAVAVGGITASVLVGVLTFGVGFAVGFPLTVAATAATATAAGTTVALVAHYFGNAAELLEKMSRQSKNLQRHTLSVQENLSKAQGSNSDNNNQMSMTTQLGDQRAIQSIADGSRTLHKKLKIGLQNAKFGAQFELRVKT